MDHSQLFSHSVIAGLFCLVLLCKACSYLCQMYTKNCLCISMMDSCEHMSHFSSNKNLKYVTVY